MAYRELGTASLVVVQAVDAALNNEDKHLLIACSGALTHWHSRSLPATWRCAAISSTPQL